MKILSIDMYTDGGTLVIDTDNYVKYYLDYRLAGMRKDEDIFDYSETVGRIFEDYPKDNMEPLDYNSKELKQISNALKDYDFEHNTSYHDKLKLKE